MNKPAPLIITITQLRAAMRVALGPVFECCDETTPDIADGLEDAIEDIEDAIAHVFAAPCECPEGIHCPYPGQPPGDADTAHCQQCGHYMPETFTCPTCGQEYVEGEDEEEDDGYRVN